MVVELLDESQEWRVEFPNEDVYRGRTLEARSVVNGEPKYAWDYSDEYKTWVGQPALGGTPRGFDWSQVLVRCLNCGWSLHSVPEAGDGQ